LNCRRAGFVISPYRISGEGGIRTLGMVAHTPVFESAKALNEP
jgi:hypothetical protein